VNCETVAQGGVPVCYSALDHPQLSRDGGRTMLVTFTRSYLYDVVVFEVTAGTAVREYRRPDGAIAYAVAPPDEDAADQGIAFYASDVSLPGFAPVSRWTRDGESVYAIDAPGSGFAREGIAFFAPPAPAIEGSMTGYRPVYDWRNGASQVLSTLDAGLEQYGYAREGVAFYAAVAGTTPSDGGTP
jgi:hypothetical protein